MASEEPEDYSKLSLDVKLGHKVYSALCLGSHIVSFSLFGRGKEKLVQLSYPIGICTVSKVFAGVWHSSWERMPKTAYLASSTL